MVKTSKVKWYEVDKKPIAVLFDLQKQKNFQANERKDALNHGKVESQPMIQFPDLSQFADPETLE